MEDFPFVTLRAKQLLDMLRTFGLDISIDSGGYLPPSVQLGSLKKDDHFIRIDSKNGAPLVIMSADLFLKTVQRTEDSLNVKLFV